MRVHFYANESNPFTSLLPLPIWYKDRKKWHHQERLKKKVEKDFQDLGPILSYIYTEARSVLAEAPKGKKIDS